MKIKLETFGLVPILLFTFHVSLFTQPMDSLYHHIPDPPSEMTPQSVMIRMIDGLGYRYHWASKELREEDLEYTPGNEVKTTIETLRHLYGLAFTIDEVVNGRNLMRPADLDLPPYPELRAKTLEKLRSARTALQDVEDLSSLQVTFQRGEKTSSFSIYHLINGQIADALYHTGQIVAYRRASGNPMSNKANVFTGRSRD